MRNRGTETGKEGEEYKIAATMGVKRCSSGKDQVRSHMQRILGHVSAWEKKEGHLPIGPSSLVKASLSTHSHTHTNTCAHPCECQVVPVLVPHPYERADVGQADRGMNWADGRWVWSRCSYALRELE